MTRYFVDTEEYAQMVERINELEADVLCLDTALGELEEYINGLIENLRNVGEV